MSERAVNDIKWARVIACKKFLNSPEWDAAGIGSDGEAELLAEFIEEQRRAAIEAAAQVAENAGYYFGYATEIRKLLDKVE